MLNAAHPFPAIGLVELSSIARGIATCDAMVKKANIRLIRAGTTHPGKYTILFRGGVGEVEESMRAGLAAAADALIDSIVLANPHVQLEAVLEAERLVAHGALGILESYSIAGLIRAADGALKATGILANKIRLGDDIGGKAYFVFSGALHDVETSMDVAVELLGNGLLAGREIIANPHGDVFTSV